MKKIILIGVLLGAVILGFIYLNNFSKKEKNVDQKVVRDINLSSYKLENIEFSYSKNNIGDFNKKVYEDNNIKTTYVELPFQNIQFVDNYQGDNKNIPATLSVYVVKNTNNDNLPIDKWLEIDSNNPQNDKQAPMSYKQESITVSGQKGMQHSFSSNDSRVNFSLYELVTLYIPYKTDIYQVNYYRLPENPDQVFTLEDIQNAKDYEKIVDQIIQSIRFVD